jgi:hypothetical protein
MPRHFNRTGDPELLGGSGAYPGWRVLFHSQCCFRHAAVAILEIRRVYVRAGYRWATRRLPSVARRSRSTTTRAATKPGLAGG